MRWDEVEKKYQYACRPESTQQQNLRHSFDTAKIVGGEEGAVVVMAMQSRLVTVVTDFASPTKKLGMIV